MTTDTLRREYLAMGAYIVVIGAAQFAVPEQLVAVPGLVAAAVFAGLGVYRAQRWPVTSGLRWLAAAMTAVALMSAALYQVGAIGLARLSDLLGSIVICAAVLELGRMHLSDRVVRWQLAACTASAGACVWSIVGYRIIRAGGSTLSAAEFVASVSIDIAALAMAVLMVSRVDIGRAVFAGSCAAIVAGDALYVVDAGFHPIGERWLLLPFALAYANAVCLFLPATARRILRVRRQRGALRRAPIIASAGLGAAIISAIALAPISAADRLVRLGLLLVAAIAVMGCFAVWTEARHAAGVDRAGLDIDRRTGLRMMRAVLEELDTAPPVPTGHHLVAYAVVVENLDHVAMTWGQRSEADAAQLLATRLERATQPHGLVTVDVSNRFVVLSSQPPVDAISTAARLQQAAALPAVLPFGSFMPAVSVGYAHAPDLGAEQLAHSAVRTALLAASRGGRTVIPFDRVKGELLLAELHHDDAVRLAVEYGTFSCQVRTVVAVTGDYVGTWCSAVWSVADQTLTSGEIERRLDPDHALAAFSQSLQAGLELLGPDGVLFVEVLGRQLEHPNIVPAVSEACRRARVAVDRLVLMAHERDIEPNIEAVAVGIESLVGQGARFGIYGFGDANLGLSRMRGYPIAFVAVSERVGNKLHNPTRRLLAALVGSGDALGFSVIAPAAHPLSPADRQHLLNAGVQHVVIAAPTRVSAAQT